MKKQHFVILVLTMVTLLLFVSGCNHSPAAVVPSGSDTATGQALSTGIDSGKNIVFHANEGKFDDDFIKNDLNELEKITVAVVKATPLETKPNPDLDKYTAIMLTTIRIDDVLKSDGIVQEGSTKILVEYYMTAQDPNDKSIMNIFSSNGSMPLKMGQQYLLFLQESPQSFGDYAVAGGWQGKFPINAKTKSHKFADISIEDLEFPEGRPIKNYRVIAEQAFEKYLK